LKDFEWVEAIEEKQKYLCSFCYRITSVYKDRKYVCPECGQEDEEDWPGLRYDDEKHKIPFS